MSEAAQVASTPSKAPFIVGELPTLGETAGNVYEDDIGEYTVFDGKILRLAPEPPPLTCDEALSQALNEDAAEVLFCLPPVNANSPPKHVEDRIVGILGEDAVSQIFCLPSADPSATTGAPRNPSEKSFLDAICCIPAPDAALPADKLIPMSPTADAPPAAAAAATPASGEAPAAASASKGSCRVGRIASSMTWKFHAPPPPPHPPPPTRCSQPPPLHLHSEARAHAGVPF
jgi:hypothetical protein